MLISFSNISRVKSRWIPITNRAAALRRHVTAVLSMTANKQMGIVAAKPVGQIAKLVSDIAAMAEQQWERVLACLQEVCQSVGAEVPVAGPEHAVALIAPPALVEPAIVRPLDIDQSQKLGDVLGAQFWQRFTIISQFIFNHQDIIHA